MEPLRTNGILEPSTYSPMGKLPCPCSKTVVLDDALAFFKHVILSCSICRAMCTSSRPVVGHMLDLSSLVRRGM